MDTAPIYTDIGTFAVQLSTYILMETHIKWLPCTSSDKDSVRRLGYIMMRVYFMHQYVRDTVVILEEGNLSHPWCPQCDMLVSLRALNGRHLATTQYAMGAEWKRWRLAEEELREILERAFKAYGEP